jgi:hypothetical protein
MQLLAAPELCIAGGRLRSAAPLLPARTGGSYGPAPACGCSTARVLKVIDERDR